jgi:membrane protease YdiL (CAAX protease family)
VPRSSPQRHAGVGDDDDHRIRRPVRSARPRTALALVAAVAVAGNVALNLLVPAALYVPAAVGTALVAVVVAARVGGCGADDLGMARSDLGAGLRLGAAALAVTAAALALAAAVPATRELFADRRVDAGSAATLLYVTLVRVPLGTVLLEETLFRGVLLGLLLRLRRTPWQAAAWSSALFGLWHILPARTLAAVNPVVADTGGELAGSVLGMAVGVPGAALAGLVFCWLRLRSRSLLAPALLHVATNSIGYTLAWLVLRAG